MWAYDKKKKKSHKYIQSKRIDLCVWLIYGFFPHIFIRYYCVNMHITLKKLKIVRT